MITSVIFGIMIYIYVELQQQYNQKIRLDKIKKLNKEIKNKENKENKENNKINKINKNETNEENEEIKDMEKVYTEQEELKYFNDEQGIANIILSGEKTPLNSIVNQALIQQRRGRPEQSINIIDQSLRQSPQRITSIQTNVVSLPLSFEASQVDASNPFRDSTRPVRN